MSIHGCGGVDMKAGTAASVIAFTLLQKKAEHLKGSVGLPAVSDEETGGKWGPRCLSRILALCPRGSVTVLNGEPGGLQSARSGEKGTLRITFTINTKGANGAHTFLSRGANIIAARLISKLLKLENFEPNLPDALRRHFDPDRARKVADDIMGPGAANSLLKPTVNIYHPRRREVNAIPERCIFES